MSENQIKIDVSYNHGNISAAINSTIPIRVEMSMDLLTKNVEIMINPNSNSTLSSTDNNSIFITSNIDKKFVEGKMTHSLVNFFVSIRQKTIGYGKYFVKEFVWEVFKQKTADWVLISGFERKEQVTHYLINFFQHIKL